MDKNSTVIKVAKGNGKGTEYKRVPCQHLNKYYCITPEASPYNKTSLTRPIKKVLTHTKSGLKLKICRSKKSAISLWDKIKSLDIMYSDTDTLRLKQDYEQLYTIVKYH